MMTVLTLTLAVLLGVVGGAVAHAVMADHQASSPATALPALVADHDPAADHDRTAVPGAPCPERADDPRTLMAAPCCSGLMAPARAEATRAPAGLRVAWDRRNTHCPGTRLIAPEPPPPKPSA
ncbi:hypothetical protein [Azospirillum soli]|uniref:hypothetical protein n=1 Tax=Azospirillum soli TaxID=1304799 RepID=UPI001AE2C886|nr:hypothetical protein [Azospirillum soli]MBP2311811.1 hypothetical protein [Azospirillum soli]